MVRRGGGNSRCRLNWCFPAVGVNVVVNELASFEGSTAAVPSFRARHILGTLGVPGVLKQPVGYRNERK